MRNTDVKHSGDLFIRRGVQRIFAKVYSLPVASIIRPLKKKKKFRKTAQRGKLNNHSQKERWGEITVTHVEPIPAIEQTPNMVDTSPYQHKQSDNYLSTGSHT